MIKGKVIAVLPQTSGQGKNGEWKSQDFVIETDGQYPKKVCLNVFGDKVPIPKIDDTVDVSYDPESREYNGRWFTNLRAFKIDVVGSASKAEPIQQTQPTASEGSDLPF
jgi:hypothetical protein